MNRQRTLVAIIALPGLLALFLPFAYSTSPFDVVLKPSDMFFRDVLWWYAAPFFLAVVIAVWLVRRLWGRRISTGELALAYVLSSLAMLSILTFVFRLELDHHSTGAILSLGVAGILALLNILFLVRNRRKHWNTEDAAEAFLLAGYLPNAVFCLIAFFPHFQSGAIAVALACIAYVTRIVLLTRKRSQEATTIVQV